jgi:hypothetical protein
LVEAYLEWPKQYRELMRKRPRKKGRKGKEAEERRWQRSLENTRKMFEAMKLGAVSSIPFKI